MEVVKAYQLEAKHPPYSIPQTELISGPFPMWEMVIKKRLLVGLTDGIASIVPEGQNITNDGVHIMLTPFTSSFVGIKEVHSDTLEGMVKRALLFVNGFGYLATSGYHISSDPYDRRPQPQSWPNLHFHLIKFPSNDELLPLGFAPESTRELGYKVMGNLLAHYLDPAYKEHFKAQFIGEEQKPIFVPRGGILIRLTPRFSYGDVADLLKKFDHDYREIHEKIFSLFVDNYEQVKEENWRIPYHLKEPSEISNSITNEGLDEASILFLRRLANQLQPEEAVDSTHLILRSPSYSCSFFREDATHNLFLFFHPHIVRQAGFPQALGIDVKRQVLDTSDLKKRTADGSSVAHLLNGFTRKYL